ncbi:3-hydroxyacyl-CoA dehydrogenase NAD-binding domain-containing protein [Tropicibacter sp. Alg240-R139]|uniref:3-hydroxyacyl-CoA dehydrogenase NAD-binding domain-containing protein n=1 Tax=Tropicibacter sp. Alg240-R139 TaxID=2305991 RepID=UPI0013E01070|nr:3-hydroxyacyl-CoA dehydrogenase NAD-binding domain-containing protein [Tropicibacter sp. Alg240-R139]
MTIRYERDGDIAVLVADNPPLNTLGEQTRKGLSKGITRAIGEGAKAVVIYGDGRSWFAGADIREFGRPPVTPYLPDVCNQIEACPVPVIAAMHGTVLGGGLEIALACHYRVAVETAKMGMPEVNLGVIPGAGGTQRLPRLAGFAPAIEMITGGRSISASKALKLGIIDRIAEGNPKEIGLDYAASLLRDDQGPRPVSAMNTPQQVDFAAAKAKVKQTARGQLSPLVALDAIEASSRLSFAEGLAVERRLFHSSEETGQCKGMIHAFFAERQVSNLPELRGIMSREVSEIGVIGGGTMGAGIATAALLAGLRVTLIEITRDATEAAKARIGGNLSGALKRGKISEAQYDRIFAESLTLSTEYGDLSDTDLIIEAVFEDMAVKKQVFAQIEAIAKPSAILASNTSFLDINEIAASTGRARNVIGLHFFSPAHVMRLLEVIVGDETAPDVVATGFALGKRLNKIAVRSGVCDGFIGNRILSRYSTAADHMVLDGASPYQIDRVVEGFGLPMGPFAMADLAGLDIGQATRKRLAPTRDPRDRVPTYADTLCEKGHRGQKTGRGYYAYDGRARTENADVLPLIDAERERLGIKARTFDDDEILRRYMAAMVNEAARVVGEGIARRPLDVDVVLLMGYGFPRYHGGPLKWADMQGLSGILSDIQEFAKDDSYFWQPAPLLEQLVAQGRTFDDLNKEQSV